jgi:cyclase
MSYERIEEDVYVFSSDIYAQVAAGLVFTPAGAVVIDTLPFPSETRTIISFEQRRGLGGVRYVVNTHYHADHVYGNYLFPRAKIISHEYGRAMLAREGEASLQQAKEETGELLDVELRLADITVDKGGAIHLGGKSLELIPLPGHSPDLIGVLLVQEKILFAGDAMMPVPYIVYGDIALYKQSLKKMEEMQLENLVQGHGEVLLRGEITEAIQANIAYLDNIRARVSDGIELGLSEQEIAQVDIEECGLSRVPLGGLVQQLHRANLISLYRGMMSGEIPMTEEPEPAEQPEGESEEAD